MNRPQTSWFLVLVAGMVLASCQKEEEPQAQPPAVQVMEVDLHTVPIYSEWVGQTRGSVNTEVRARVQGYLDAVLFEEGRPVQQGTVMYRINPLEYQAYLDQARGKLAEAQADLARATADVVRYEPLVRENAISREEYETSVSMQKAARASVDAAEAAVKKANLDLSYCTVIAPITGLAGKTEVQVGNLVGRGDNTLLTTISQIDPIRVRFSLSERELLDFRRRRVNQQARTIDLSLVLADGTSFDHRGRLVLADNRVDPQTGTLLLEAEFPNPEKLLQPGQFARIRAVTDVEENVVIVPQRAISELQGQARLAVVGGDGKVTFRSVEVGPRVGSGYVILSGIKSGEKVIIEGLQKVRDGAVVKAQSVRVDVDSLVNRN